MNVFFSFLIIISFLTFSCTSNQELEKLKHENQQLKKKLATYNNALVLTPENIHEYINAMTFSQLEGNKNESIPFTTCLTLARLPQNMHIKWSSTPEGMFVKKDGVTRHVENSYPTSGKHHFTGMYTVVFPNGQEWHIPWERDFEVK